MISSCSVAVQGKHKRTSIWQQAAGREHYARSTFNLLCGHLAPFGFALMPRPAEGFSSAEQHKHLITNFVQLQRTMCRVWHKLVSDRERQCVGDSVLKGRRVVSGGMFLSSTCVTHSTETNSESRQENKTSSFIDLHRLSYACM